MADKSGLIRPVSYQEGFLYEANSKDGFCYISYVMRISTARKLTEEDGKKVFTSLYRKTPNLRLCIEEKDGVPWVKEMQEEKIDFKVIENADVYETYHRIAEDPPLNFVNGPLWQARLLPYSPSQDSFIQGTKSSDGETSKFQNVYHVVVLFSHSITDGYSCVRIMRAILSLFNSVLAGEKINDKEQIGKRLDLSHEKKKKDYIRKLFLDDPAFLEKRKQGFGDFPLETLFEKAYPVAPFLKPRTLCLVHVVDEATTKKFVSRCKKEGLTVHTGFCALVEASIIKMLLAKGFNQELYKISSVHAADNRVYYDNCHDEFGVGMGIMDYTNTVSKQEMLTNFWSAAKKWHASFKEQHRHMPGLEHDIIEQMTNFNPIVLLPKEGQASPSKTMSYYCTTNMRDITSLLGDRGDHIQLEFMDRLTTMHMIPCIFMNTYNTFRGKFIHSLQYNAHIMDDQVAKKYSDTLFQMFSEVCEA